MNNPSIAARISREVGILAGRLAALLEGALSGPGGSGTGPLAEGRAFLQASFESVAGGHRLTELQGSALTRPAADGPHPIDRLGLAFGLKDPEADLVLLAGLPEEHEGYASVLRALNPRGEPWLPAGLAAQLLFHRGADRIGLRTALESGPLMRQGVLRLLGDGPYVSDVSNIYLHRFSYIFLLFII